MTVKLAPSMIITMTESY